MLLDVSALTNAVSSERQRDDDRESVIERFRRDDAVAVPLEFTDLDIWANYMNDDLYEMDSKVREFLKGTRYRRYAKDGMRTTVPIVFSWIYGRQPAPGDGSACRLLHTLMKYYCTSYTGATTYQGKPVNRVYRFTRYATNSKRPYSLRLRLEEAQGESKSLFKNGPNSVAYKGPDGGRPDRKAGKREAGRRGDGRGGNETEDRS